MASELSSRGSANLMLTMVSVGKDPMLQALIHSQHIKRINPEAWPQSQILDISYISFLLHWTTQSKVKRENTFEGLWVGRQKTNPINALLNLLLNFQKVWKGGIQLPTIWKREFEQSFPHGGGHNPLIKITMHKIDLVITFSNSIQSSIFMAQSIK